MKTAEETKLPAIIRFLNGECEFDGVWYGDKNPREIGHFWWRKHLIAEMKSLVASRDKEIVALKDEIKAAEELEKQMLERFRPYLKDGALDYTDNLVAQMNVVFDLRFKEIIDRKHATNVDLMIKMESLVASRDKEIKELKEENKRLSETDDYLRGHVEGYADATVHSQSQIQHLEEVVKAADEVMSRTSWNQGDSYHEAKEIYTKLKAAYTKLKAGSETKTKATKREPGE